MNIFTQNQRQITLALITVIMSMAVTIMASGKAYANKEHSAESSAFDHASPERSSESIEIQKLIALALQIEHVIEKSKPILVEIEQGYLNGELDIEMLFEATVQHEYMKEMLQETRGKLLVILNQTYQRESATLVAKVDATTIN